MIGTRDLNPEETLQGNLGISDAKFKMLMEREMNRVTTSTPSTKEKI